MQHCTDTKINCKKKKESKDIYLLFLEGYYRTISNLAKHLFLFKIYSKQSNSVYFFLLNSLG